MAETPNPAASDAVDPTTLPTRDRILLAAIQIYAEGLGARLSVRAVAARAGVSSGSLRHHFPTQRGLLDAVLTTLYDRVMPSVDMTDRDVPARDRLAASLQEMLDVVGVGERARRTATVLVERFVAPEQTDELRESYLAIEAEVRGRVEGWLTGLVEEGALAPGDTTRRAQVLLTVLNGLTIERALPSAGPRPEVERATIEAVVDGVLAAR